MDRAAQLEKQLREHQVTAKGELQIKGWYFGLNENVSIKAGMKNSRIGGVYSCPRAEESVRGKVYIIWQDNRRSVASLNSNTTENFQRLIKIWRRFSFADETAAEIYKDDHYPTVKLFDQGVHQLVYENQYQLFDYLDRYNREMKAFQIGHVDASVSASSFQQYIKNAKGLNIENQATSFSTFLYGDGLYGRSYIKRRLIKEEELDYLIRETSTTVNRLKNREPLSGGDMAVILLPGVLQSFINHYLLSNLRGSQVFNGRSAFTAAEFKQQASVLRSDMNLAIDTLIDYNQGSYISTFEGVSGGKKQLIHKGRLLSPMLDLKYAKLMDLEPTPVHGGTGSIQFYADEMDSFQELLKTIEKGIIVYDVLGMHTQDAASGNFSLTAPNCIRIERGIMKEACKAVITGNFFEVLQDQFSRLGKIPLEDHPCLLMKINVTGEK